MTFRKVQINWILLFLSGFLSLGFIIIFYASLNENFLNLLFSSDSLYLPSLYKDFFVEHGKVSSWMFNSSPNFIPDMLLYFPLNFITGNFRIATILFSLLQQLILLILLYLLFSRIFGKRETDYLILVFLLTIVFIIPFFTASDYYLSFLFTSNTFHFGTFIMALLSLNLAFRYVEKRNKRILILLIFIQIAGFLSDRLFMILFTGPAFVTFALGWKNRQWLVLAGVQIFVILTGFILFNNLNGYFGIHVGVPHKIYEVSLFFESLQMMMQHFTFYLKSYNTPALILIMAFTSFVATAIIVIKNFRKIIDAQLPDLGLMYLIFSVVFFAAVIIAPLLNGNYTNFDTVRYIVFAFYLTIFNIPLILWLYRKKISPRLIKISGVIIFCGFVGYGIFLTTKINPVKQLKFVAGYYPSLVEKVDKIAIEENLKFGLANYWDAKFISMFSKSGVKIFAVHDDLCAYTHVSNVDWYYGCDDCQTGERVFNFVLLNRFKNKDAIVPLTDGNSKFINNDEIELVITKPFVMSRKLYGPVIFDNLND